VLSAGGLGFSDHFAHDGDDTAAALAVLAANGMQADYALLAPFQRADHFVAYPFEMHVSHAVTARATIALHQGGQDALPWQRCILTAQGPDGWWSSEKWNRSRLYGTMLALSALSGVEEQAAADARAKAAAAFLRYQRADGGWGCFESATPVETALGLLALFQIAKNEAQAGAYLPAIEGAHAYLRRHYNPRTVGDPCMWISKDLYSARRVDHAAVLCALLAPLSTDLLRGSQDRSRIRIVVAHE
jgi:squalene cyclase